VTRSTQTQDRRRLAELLRKLREDSGLRQIDVAERIGLQQSFVSKYETGERRLDLIELQEVSTALGLTLSAVVKRFERPQ
jgi:transcriptional regulator with XRE-family HTH domain